MTLVARVSPEFRLRPSLSVHPQRSIRPQHARVAGVQTPAFVERFEAMPSFCQACLCRRSSDSGLR